MTTRVLIVDDDRRLTAMLATWTASRGVALTAAHSVAEGLAALRTQRFDALILDLMLPDGDGLDACRQIRTQWPALPVLMLTARGDPTDRVIGLEMGADDYLAKPFDPRELLARIRAVLRRMQRGSPRAEVLHFGELTINRQALTVHRGSTPVPLTAHQFQVLWALASRAGRVLDRAQLSRAVGDDHGDILDRTIDVHISRIRAAIETDPRRPRHIKTVRGAGYVFVPGGG